jgi:murein L,D-transpeptidase YcbB/YkuD
MTQTLRKILRHFNQPIALDADGIIGAHRELNVPVGQRIDELKINLEGCAGCQEPA